MKMLHASSSTHPVSSHHHHPNGHHHPQQQQSSNPNLVRDQQQQQQKEENLYSSPSMERKRMITRKEQEDLDKLLKDMIEELETFPETSTYTSTTYRTPQQQLLNHHNNNNSRFQRNTSQTRSFSHSPSVRSPPAIISYNRTTDQSCRSTPLSGQDVTDSSPQTAQQYNFNQSHHPLSSQLIPQQSQQRQQVSTQAVVHNHSHHHHQAPSSVTSVSSNQGTMKGVGGGGITSAGQPYSNIYGTKSVPGQSEYTYGQVKPPPPLKLMYQPANASLMYHQSSREPTAYTTTGHSDEHDFIGYTRSTPCSGGGSGQQQTFPVMPVGPPHITKQHDIPSYSPAPSRSSAKSVTLTPTPKPVTLQQSDNVPRSISADRNLRLSTTRVIPGAKIDLEDHDRSGVYASVLGKKSLSRCEREELDELVNVMMEEVKNFPDYTPGPMSKRGTPFRRSVSHGSSGVSRQTMTGQQQPGGSRVSRMESRSPTRSLNQSASLNRFTDRSTSWNRGILRDTQSPGRCSRVLEQGSHGHGHNHGPGGQCGIANGGIVKPVSPLPPHLLTRPTQWIEDEVSGGHRDKTPYHARADSRPFTYGVTPTTAYPVLQRRRQNTESTAYIVENNPRPEQFTTFKNKPGGPPGDGSSSRSSHFTSGPNIQPGVLQQNRGQQDPNYAIYAVPRGSSNYQQQQQQQQYHHQLNSSSSNKYSNDPLYSEQQRNGSSLPKIATVPTHGATIENDGVFSETGESYSSAIDSSLCDESNLSWLQRQQNKLKVRRSSLDSHDRQVRENMFNELIGTVSGRKVPAINDSSRESSPLYQSAMSPISPTRMGQTSPDRRQRTPSPPRAMVLRQDRNRSPEGGKSWSRGSKINVVDESPEFQQETTKPKVNYSSGPTFRSLQRQKSDSSFDRYASRPTVIASKEDSKGVPRSPSIPLYATVNQERTKPYDKYEDRINSFMSPPTPDSNLVRHSSTGLLLRPGPPTTTTPVGQNAKSPIARSPPIIVTPANDRPKSPLSPVLVRPGSKSPRSRSPVRVEFKLDSS